MIYLFIGSVVLNLLFAYVVVNLLLKTEKYEDALDRYFDSTLNILSTARTLDEKQMFEKDDEVGSLFQELMFTIGDLRGVIYGEPNDQEEK